MDIHGVLMSLPGQFVSRQVVSFAVCDGSCAVGVGCQVVELCDAVVRALWHGCSPTRCKCWYWDRDSVLCHFLVGIPVFFRNIVL
jgi:hypothetical protein